VDRDKYAAEMGYGNTLDCSLASISCASRIDLLAQRRSIIFAQKGKCYKVSRMKILRALFILVLLPSIGLAQAGRGAQPALQIQPIKPALYMVTGAGANSLIRITNDGVILVDGKLPGDQNYSGLIDQIKTVTDKPVKFVIVTHHHADHTGNNAKFLAAGAQIVAHANLAKNLETYQSPNFD